MNGQGATNTVVKLTPNNFAEKNPPELTCKVDNYVGIWYMKN